MTYWVRLLIFANMGAFLLQQVAPGVTNAFAFIPAYILRQPWTLFTYMFLHDPSGFSHILFNMFALYIFGPRVEALIGGRRFISLYLISGVMGGLLSIIFAPFSPIIGASGAVFGVQLAFAMKWPRDKIFIWGVLPIEARWLVVLTTVMSLYGGFGGGAGGVAHFAHLGGYLGAFAYLKWLDLRAPAKQWQRKVAGPPPSAVPVGDWQRVDLNSVHEANRDEVNRILDKITATGLRSLTTQERTFLSHFVPKDESPQIQ
jgi:membrane associated rhomboid family serine protease